MKNPRPAGRGNLLLLDHCARLERMTGAGGLSARERLEAQLGNELTRVLLGSRAGEAGAYQGRSRIRS